VWRAANDLAPVPAELARPYTSSGARGLLKVGFGLDPGDERYEALRLQFLDFYAREFASIPGCSTAWPNCSISSTGTDLPWGAW